MSQPTLELVCSQLGIPLEKMINLYVGGSRLYGCHHEKSDYDLFLIVHNDTTLPQVNNKEWVSMEDDNILLTTKEFDNTIDTASMPKRSENCISYRSDVFDVNIYKECQFTYELENYLDCSLFEYASLSHHDGSSPVKMQCTLLERKPYPIKPPSTPENKSDFRRPFSRKSSNSFVKCKKKLCVELDLMTGLKSMFHSMRIISFAIQILKYGYIKQFDVANEYFVDIMQYSNVSQDKYEEVWNILNTKYGEIRKKLEKEFHTLAPKIGLQKNQKKPKQ